ncbi:MAG: ATP-grasp domain-containing protein [Candidatus Methylomirabilales bacterium]
MSVLVTPGNLRSALAVTRSLGRQGIPVAVADEQPRSLAGASRYCQKAIRVPSPATAGSAFVHEIRQILSRNGVRVVIPADDVALTLLAEARPRFEGLAAFPFPDREAIQLAHDKSVVMLLAQEHGIPVPKTVLVHDPDDVTEAIRRVGFPAVVKPRLSHFRRNGEWVRGGGPHYVSTVRQLEAACRRIHETVPLPLVQEYIPGEGRGVFLLMNQGKLRAAFAHRRIREKPPSGGVSVLSESVGLDSQLLQYSQCLLGALKWHGVAMVEFKHDARDGNPKLLEVNGRFWGSLQLAVDAGMDFPHLLYRLALDGDIEPTFSYQEGIRLRWGLGNLDWLLLRLRDASPSKVIREFLRHFGKGARNEVFRWDDPRPALEELSQYVGQILRGGSEKLRRTGRHE